MNPVFCFTKFWGVKGKLEPLVLPKGLKEAIEKAEIFSSENESNDVIVELRPTKFKITGKGISGWHTETKKSKYNDRPLQFTIPAKLLTELVNQYNKCELSSTHLKVAGGKFVYVTVLGEIEKKEEEE